MKKDIIAKIDEKFGEMEAGLKSLKSTATSLEQRLETAETIAKLQEDTIKCQEDTIYNLNLKIEDQINRSCRSTLVFDNVPENDEKNWGETEDVLYKALAPYLNEVPELDLQCFKKNIERAHRGYSKTKLGGRGGWIITARIVTATRYPWPCGGDTATETKTKIAICLTIVTSTKTIHIHTSQRWM